MFYILRSSFTKCKQTRQVYVCCNPCCLQLFVFLTNNSNPQAIANFTLTYTSRFINIPLCNNRPTTVYPSNNNVCLISDTINRVGDVTQEQCTICCPDTAANTPTQTDKQHNMYCTWSKHQFHPQFNAPFFLSAKHKHQYRFV